MQHKFNTSTAAPAWPSVHFCKVALLESGACVSLICLNARLPSSHPAFLTLPRWYVLLLLYSASWQLWERLRPVHFCPCLILYGQLTSKIRDGQLCLSTIRHYTYSARTQDRQAGRHCVCLLLSFSCSCTVEIIVSCLHKCTIVSFCQVPPFFSNRLCTAYNYIHLPLVVFVSGLLLWKCPFSLCVHYCNVCACLWMCIRASDEST